MTQKVDPSVSELDLYTKGPMRGEVPVERTIRKPEAYSSPNKIKLPKDTNP
jgi:hypothetical protein